MPSEQPRSPRKKARILIVDDHPIVRRGLIQLIDHEPDLQVCGEAEDAHGAVVAIEEEHPDLALVDVSLRGVSGIDLVKQIRDRFPRMIVIVLSVHDEALYAERALHAGAKGYIMKHRAAEEVLDAVRRALQGEIVVSDVIRRRLLEQAARTRPIVAGSPLEVLSDRELEIYELIGRGFGTSRIAGELHISVKTVETHRMHIKEKLNLASAGELVRHAVHWLDREIRSPSSPVRRHKRGE